MDDTSKPPHITRSDYLAGNATHSEYYSQFVTPGVLDRVKQALPLDALKKGEGDHFNNIPLGYWDMLMPSVPAEIAERLKACGDYPTKAGVVCILKEAARQIIQDPVTL